MKLAEKLEDQKKQNRAYVEVRSPLPALLLSTIRLASYRRNSPVSPFSDPLISDSDKVRARTRN
jgi:hypothetical protein